MDNSKQMDFELNYTLLAKTPMIHFQYDQVGATLRASEVKPRLDQYLHKVCGKIPEDWLISKDKPALNYKMQIIAGEESKEAKNITVENCKAFFGNPRKADPKPKDLVFRNCELKIFCFNEGLRKAIDKHIGDFFVLHNFGTRQSKGFGGFLWNHTPPKMLRQ